MIVCLEGIDGSGKSTQAPLLAERLKGKAWKFPNRDSPTGKIIYAHLERKWTVVRINEPMADDELARTEAIVFQALQLANRMEVASELFQAAAVGNVVFDRYWPSGYAYGKADGLDGDYLVKLHAWLPQPDLFVLLDIPRTESARRRPDRRDRYELDHKKLEEAGGFYRDLWAREAKAAPHRWQVVDAYAPVAEVTARLEAAVARWRSVEKGA